MTLPGMPIKDDDPGVHVCGPDDIAPWERGDVRPARRPRSVATRDTDTPMGAWLVLTRCARCARLRAYCSTHRLDWAFRHLDADQGDHG